MLPTESSPQPLFPFETDLLYSSLCRPVVELCLPRPPEYWLGLKVYKPHHVGVDCYVLKLSILVIFFTAVAKILKKTSFSEGLFHGCFAAGT